MVAGILFLKEVIMKQEKIDFYFDEIRKILSASHDIPTEELYGINEWKEIWTENKSKFFPYFDEDGRKQISIDTNNEVSSLKKSDFYALINDIYSLGWKFIKSGKFSNVNVYTTIDYFRLVLDKFTIEEIIKNRIITAELPDPNRSEKLLPKGTKVSKYVSYLQGYAGVDSVSEDVRNEITEFVNILYSQFLNMLSSFGTVVLSINPLDFLLVSAHTTGWKSCHNFQDGCFKTGGVSYMLDHVSLVGYAYTESRPLEFDYYKTNFDIPVKMWRAMVFMDIDNRSAIVSRQYPDVKDIFARYLRKLVGRTLAEMVGIEPKWKVKIKTTGSSSSDEEDDDTDYYKLSSKSCFNYTDPITNIIRLKEQGRYPNLRIGSKTIPCMVCGCHRNDNEYGASEYFTCEYCRDEDIYCESCNDPCDTNYEAFGRYYCESCFYELFTYCRECDELISRDDAYYYGDDPLCELCRDRYYTYCDRCNELERNSNIMHISDINEDWCDHCARHYARLCNDCGEYVKYAVLIDGYYYCEDCAEERKCEECGEYSTSVKDGKCGDCRCLEVRLESVGV
jgi:hypothetical protein